MNAFFIIAAFSSANMRWSNSFIPIRIWNTWKILPMSSTISTSTDLQSTHFSKFLQMKSALGLSLNIISRNSYIRGLFVWYKPKFNFSKLIIRTWLLLWYLSLTCLILWLKIMILILIMTYGNFLNSITGFTWLTIIYVGNSFKKKWIPFLRYRRFLSGTRNPKDFRAFVENVHLVKLCFVTFLANAVTIFIFYSLLESSVFLFSVSSNWS